ncbi:MAG: hypothetical protein JWO45_1130 [Spartobacteria bacterium]|nr:hypothetical protein [Spartobacteria bacterium]
MSDPAPRPEASLLFDWAPPEGEKLAIAMFLVASVVLHAFCFYLFQIIYPPAVAVLSPPARVNLIAPNSEEGRTVLRWVDAEDPAIASATLRPPESRSRNLPKLQHVPSYLTEEAHLKQLPPVNVVPRAPSALPPGPVPTARPQKEPPQRLVATSVLLSDELKLLGSVSFPAEKFSASNNETPESVAFRLGVGVHGEVRYCFRLNSSGDSALDEQARRHLVLSRFPARSLTGDGSEQSLTWGVATVEWGNDVARPPSAPNPSPP